MKVTFRSEALKLMWIGKRIYCKNAASTCLMVENAHERGHAVILVEMMSIDLKICLHMKVKNF